MSPFVRKPEWIDDTRFRLAGEEFACGFEASVDGRMVVCKPRPLLEKTISLLHQLSPTRIFELGIRQGGSVAVNALVAAPDVLVAVEIIDARVAPLDSLIRRHGLDRSVHLHYGTDQADRQRIARIAEAESGGAPYDLIVDDASHWIEETRASFETLFPRLRPGGVYVIEDWNWQLRSLRKIRESFREDVRSGRIDRDGLPLAAKSKSGNPYVAYFFKQMHRVPLERLAVELVLAQSCSEAVFASVTVDHPWITIVRGPAEIDAATFRITDHFADYTDHRQTLATPQNP